MYQLNWQKSKGWAFFSKYNYHGYHISFHDFLHTFITILCLVTLSITLQAPYHDNAGNMRSTYSNSWIGGDINLSICFFLSTIMDSGGTLLHSMFYKWIHDPFFWQGQWILFHSVVVLTACFLAWTSTTSTTSKGSALQVSAAILFYLPLFGGQMLDTQVFEKEMHFWRSRGWREELLTLINRIYKPSLDAFPTAPCWWTLWPARCIYINAKSKDLCMIFVMMIVRNNSQCELPIRQRLQQRWWGVGQQGLEDPGLLDIETRKMTHNENEDVYNLVWNTHLVSTPAHCWASQDFSGLDCCLLQENTLCSSCVPGIFQVNMLCLKQTLS